MNEWRNLDLNRKLKIGSCFFDLRSVSLNSVLLSKRIYKPSIPVVHAIGMKGTYESMPHILNSIKYKDHHWQFLMI
jgi:hypothetical protein